MKNVLNAAKNERGLTLIELLAVIVILGIIAAIAVPSIGGIIDNSKKDAHIANAEQMVSSARLAQVSDLAVDEENGTYEYSIEDLVEGGYIENVESPGNNGPYDHSNSTVEIDNSGDGDGDDGNENPTYTIKLAAEEGGNYISDETIDALRGSEDDEGRELVDLNGDN
ncbi:prepilin-type N-terminal cleavage/methylation domain-containing protein [Salibacterium salarium]|uniref:Prepilin-type N-terminal cleavage/methylation domain-containing protein n=1 Tax=Salibacterium salarium TaxID=284579 RepID=A0A428N1D3_9BACI|nr:prepilin-type N-terminal cleavage/methylation domain-containing protein [Salibacterium salarium]RSL32265.1 prepilin-type N-terminal cleavage/methylation domain-containing protein [Salibacterium salarium]